MKPFRTRLVILLLVAFAMGAGSLLVAGSALADTALFRIEQSWHNFPNPQRTTPGNAGLYQGYIQPYNFYLTPMGAYSTPPGKAIVEPNNPVGAPFTLPQSFFYVEFMNDITPKTGWPGYTTYTLSIYYNGPGHFGPNHGATGPTRIVFPTTMGNPYPTYTSTYQKWINGNYGDGNPVTPTTTFDGKYDFTRAGSINVTPGPRRFGGTFRLFYTPESFWYQYVAYYPPAYYKGYFDFYCRNNGVFCTPNNFVSHAGDLTTIYRGTRYLLNVKGTGTGDRLQSNTARATTSAMQFGTKPTSDGQGTPTGGGPASYIAGVQQYINLIHPWTTGFAKVHNPIGSPNVITPQLQGYDIDLEYTPDQVLTVTHIDVNQNFNFDLNTITTTTYTYKQYLKGVGRIVSMVRPRLIHTYSTPLDLDADPIVTNWQVARMWKMKVFFVPEPLGMLMLGAGIVGLLGLSRIRRR